MTSFISKGIKLCGGGPLNFFSPLETTRYVIIKMELCFVDHHPNANYSNISITGCIIENDINLAH